MLDAMIWIKVFASAVVAYMLGSVSFGVLIPRMMGASGDVRDVGSGSTGATNVLRTHGKLQGALVLVCDLLKGSVAAWIGLLLAGAAGGSVAGVCALLGHCFPLFFGFKGGKAVATSAGIIFVLFPKAMLVLIPIFIISVAVSRMVSLGSMLAAAALVGSIFLFHPGGAVGVFSVSAALIVFWKHSENIKRIRAGTENRLGRG
ncbi:MAG: glycerol-3-phosphate 1-O-acyltransferase PlsY [Clostridiales bacterium]|nr:glycerol-3-phosphate 1-O-acyltransferase PlsY [Clostridiales bacterium]